MSEVIYKMWVDSDVLREWSDLQLLKMYVHEYSISDITHIGAFEQTNDGLKPLWSAMGREAIEQRLDDTNSR